MAKFLILLLLVVPSCTRHSQMVANSSPEEVVKRFVDLSINARDISDKEKIQALCSQELKRVFQRMNPEAFKLIYVDSKITLLEFKVIAFSQEVDTAKVTYEVSVENNQGADPTREINQREVTLQRSQGQWFIDSIRTSGTDRIAFTKGMLF